MGRRLKRERVKKNLRQGGYPKKPSRPLDGKPEARYMIISLFRPLSLRKVKEVKGRKRRRIKVEKGRREKGASFKRFRAGYGKGEGGE